MTLHKSTIISILSFVCCLSVILFLKDFALPVSRENIGEAIGQMLIFFSSIGIILISFCIISYKVLKEKLGK